jgi:hypothetical protein
MAPFFAPQKNRAIRSKSSARLAAGLWAFHYYPWRAHQRTAIQHKALELP